MRVLCACRVPLSEVFIATNRALTWNGASANPPNCRIYVETQGVLQYGSFMLQVATMYTAVRFTRICLFCCSMGIVVKYGYGREVPALERHGEKMTMLVSR